MFNWDTGGETFRSNAAWSTARLGDKLQMAKGTLQGAYLFGYMVREDDPAEPPTPPRDWSGRAAERLSGWFGHPRANLILAALAGSLLLLPLLWRARTRAPRTILFAAVFLTAGWLAMALNPNTGGSVHHVVLLWPFPHMIVAVAFGEAAQKFGRPGKAALATMLAVVAASNLLVLNEYYRMLRRDGASLVWSDAVYPLADALRTLPATQIMPIDWGVFDSLRLLGAGRLPLRVGMDPLSKATLDEHDRQTVREWLATPGTIFVSHTRANEVFTGVGGRLDDVAVAAGFRKEVIGLFTDNRSRPNYEHFTYIPP
jgi:hypothetical protein